MQKILNPRILSNLEKNWFEKKQKRENRYSWL